VKALNLVTRRPWPDVALARPTRAGRLLVALPWRGRLLVGTSHGESLSGSDDTLVGAGEVSNFLAEVNDAFPWLRLSIDEVTLVHRGVVPAKHSPRKSLELLDAPEIHDHARDGIGGAVSVVGVKFTTARDVRKRLPWRSSIPSIARRDRRRRLSHPRLCSAFADFTVTPQSKSSRWVPRRQP
jgi:glycerol-3-phosphate dehydrogenase